VTGHAADVAAFLDVRAERWRPATLERVLRVPGVETATLTVTTPFRFSVAGTFRVPGLDSPPRVPT
jgi:hypothetical protein